MAKTGIGTLSVVLAFLLFAPHATGQTPREPLPGITAPFVGSPLTCSSAEKERIVVQQPFAARAKLKPRLINLLHESLYDDAKVIVNIDPEKEIKKLAK